MSKTNNNNSNTNNQINYTTWTIEEVYEWALKLKYGDEIAPVLQNQKIDGEFIDTLTEQQLTDVNQPYKLTGGSAKSLMSAIGMLKGSQQSTGGLGGQISIETILERIKKDKPYFKSLQEQHEKPPCDIFYPLEGRSKEIDKLSKAVNLNIDSFISDSKTKQGYACPLLHGNMGIGKTRLGYEYSKIISQIIKERKNGLDKMFDEPLNVFIDFSIKDKLMGNDISILGSRFFAHYFFGMGLGDIQSLLLNKLTEQEFRCLDFHRIIEYISKKLSPERNLTIFIQLDEFGYLSPDLAHRILNEIGLHMIKGNSTRILLFPILTGTNTKMGQDQLILSGFGINYSILLQPLDFEESKNICQKIENPVFRTNYLGSQYFGLFLKTLGGIPRFIQYMDQLITHGTCIPGINHLENFSFLSKKLMEKIQSVYSLQTWVEKIFSFSEKGFKTMLSWVLSGKIVLLTDMFNGISVEDARSSGILILRQKNSGYCIEMPIILLRSLNAMYPDIEDSYLDIFSPQNDFTFEKAMNTLRVYRENIEFKLKKNSITFKDLYPHALAFNSILEKTIDVKNISILHVKGLTSMHTYNAKDIPVSYTSKGKADITNGDILLSNCPKAPSCDSLVFHSDCVEVIQYKSKGAASEKNLLDIGKNKHTKTGTTIWQEYFKISDEGHNKFYGSKDIIFVVISNKHLEYFDQFKLAIQESKESFTVIKMNEIKHSTIKREIPKNLILVSGENFKEYASCFASFFDVNSEDIEMNPINQTQ